MPEPIQAPVRYEARAYYTSDLEQWVAVGYEDGEVVEGTDFDKVLEEARQVWEEGEYRGVLVIAEIHTTIHVIV